MSVCVHATKCNTRARVRVCVYVHVMHLILMAFNCITEFRCAVLHDTGFISLSKFIEQRNFLSTSAIVDHRINFSDDKTIDLTINA